MQGFFVPCKKSGSLSNERWPGLVLWVKFNMKYLYLSLLAITVLTACKKQDTIKDSPDIEISRIRYYFVDKTYFEAIYSYNQLGLLSTVTYQDSIGGKASADYQYYTGAILDSSVSVNKDNKAFNKNYYAYQNGKLVTMKHFEFDSATKRLELFYERTLTYIGSELYKTADINSYNDHNTHTIYTYTNDNVSDLKIYKTATGELLEHTVYQYDNHPNPYYNKPYTNRYNILNNKNNIVLEKLVYAKNRLPGQVNYKYTYNSRGYPLVQYIDTPNKLVAEQEFFYK
jgi:hypothetical protein